MRIPRILRDLQVERESLLLDFSFQRLFHGLDLFFGQRRQECSFRAVVSDAMSCDHQGQRSVQMLMDDRLASSQGGAPLGPLNLHDQVVKAYGVVSVILPLLVPNAPHSATLYNVMLPPWYSYAVS